MDTLNLQYTTYRNHADWCRSQPMCRDKFRRLVVRHNRLSINQKLNSQLTQLMGGPFMLFKPPLKNSNRVYRSLVSGDRDLTKVVVWRGQLCLMTPIGTLEPIFSY